jgi:predicted dehydrogenase
MRLEGGMRLGIVGRNWGRHYVPILKKLGIECWIAGRDYRKHIQGFKGADGVIVACSTAAHFDVAFDLLEDCFPVLIEKPAAASSEEVESLIRTAGSSIAFVSHTRLYSPAWRQFKRPAKRVEAWAGGVTPTNPDALLNWGVHLAAMCWDVGVDPMDAELHITQERQPLRFVADGREFNDPPTHPQPLEVLVREFVGAIVRGEPNNEGLHLALKTIQYVEKQWQRPEHFAPRSSGTCKEAIPVFPTSF